MDRESKEEGDKVSVEREREREKEGKWERAR